MSKRHRLRQALKGGQYKQKVPGEANREGTSSENWACGPRWVVKHGNAGGNAPYEARKLNIEGGANCRRPNRNKGGEPIKRQVAAWNGNGGGRGEWGSSVKKTDLTGSDGKCETELQARTRSQDECLIGAGKETGRGGKSSDGAGRPGRGGNLLKHTAGTTVNGETEREGKVIEGVGGRVVGTADGVNGRSLE